MLRSTLSRRRHFVRLQSAQTSAVKALLRAAGLGHLTRSLGSEVGWGNLLSALAEESNLRAHVEQHRALWRCAGEQVVAVEGSLAKQRQEASLAQATRRLQTIPGVGETVAATAVAVFSEVSRFPDAKHAASYVGLVSR